MDQNEDEQSKKKSCSEYDPSTRLPPLEVEQHNDGCNVHGNLSTRPVTEEQDLQALLKTVSENLPASSLAQQV